MKVNLSDKTNEELVRILQNTQLESFYYSGGYEYWYMDLCAQELEYRGLGFPEAYYHIGIYKDECCEDYESYFKKGAELGDPSCIWELYSHHYNDKNSEKFINIKNFCIENCVYDALMEESDKYGDEENTELCIKYMCEAYDALYPEYKNINKFNIKYTTKFILENYKNHRDLFERYASKHQMYILDIIDTFKRNEIPAANISNDDLFEAFTFDIENREILNYLIFERHYEKAIEYAYVNELYDLEDIKNPDSKRFLLIGIKMNLPYIVALTTRDVEHLAEEGNVYAMAEVLDSYLYYDTYITYENLLKEGFDNETLYKYAKNVAQTGLCRFRRIINATVCFLKERKFYIPDKELERMYRYWD